MSRSVLRVALRIPPLPGGMENHVKKLSLFQIKNGFEVTLCFNIGNKVSKDDIQITKINFSSLRPAFLGIFILNLILIFKLILSKKKYRIVHFHGDWGHLIFSSLIKKIVGAEKIYLTIHDELIESKLRNYLYSIFFRKPDLIFVTGQKTYKQISKITSIKSILQPSGIDDVFFKHVRRENHNLRFVTVANLVKKKNLELIIQLARKFQNCSFRVVGDGPEESRLKNLKDYFDLHNIEFLGRKNKNEIANLFEDSNFFLFTSLKEGTPTVVLEAMASGLIVISSNCGDIEDLIPDGNFISDEFNFSSFVKIFKKIINNKDLNKTSNKNIEFAKKHKWNIALKNIHKFFG